MEGYDRLRRLEAALAERGSDVALHLVYERASRVVERPALARTFFAERCTTDEALNQMLVAFRAIGAYAELYDGEKPFLRALVGDGLDRLERSLHVIYNGLGWGVTPGGFKPGRKAMLPAIADAYGLLCANSDAYTCALALHKFHSFLVLRALGVRTPATWHFRAERGWMGPAPSPGTKVIVKSTYEAWSVGVTENSVFRVGHDCEERVRRVAESIGQAVTLQEFVAGREMCVPVLSSPQKVVGPPVEQLLAKSLGDPEAVFTIDDNLNHEAVSYVPFEGPSTLVAEMQETALRTFDILQMQAFGRMDFRVDSDGRPWLTDVAISPSWEPYSSAYTSFAGLGLDNDEFLRLIVAASLGEAGVLAAD